MRSYAVDLDTAAVDLLPESQGLLKVCGGYALPLQHLHRLRHCHIYRHLPEPAMLHMLFLSN